MAPPIAFPFVKYRPSLRRYPLDSQPVGGRRLFHLRRRRQRGAVPSRFAGAEEERSYNRGTTGEGRKRFCRSRVWGFRGDEAEKRARSLEQREGRRHWVGHCQAERPAWVSRKQRWLTRPGRVGLGSNLARWFASISYLLLFERSKILLLQIFLVRTIKSDDPIQKAGSCYLKEQQQIQTRFASSAGLVFVYNLRILYDFTFLIVEECLMSLLFWYIRNLNITLYDFTLNFFTSTIILLFFILV